VSIVIDLYQNCQPRSTITNYVRLFNYNKRNDHGQNLIDRRCLF